MRCAVCLFLLCSTALGADAAKYASHPPMRPLPVASQRPAAEGPARWVDGVKGDDKQDGSRERPWKSIAHGVGQLRPGETLYVGGGTYYEHVRIASSGTPDKPLTLRAAPGELVILDGGLREFFERPAECWTPFKEGAPGEYRSLRAYPDLGGAVGGTNLLGHFGDSMVPLHGYHTLADLRSKNEFWNLDNKVSRDEEQGIYCGPGLWYDLASGHIHARLAHTQLAGLGPDNYRGETDPRQLPLVVTGFRGGSTLSLQGAKHWRIQDLVVRGSRPAAIDLVNCRDIRIEGVTAYGGQSAMRAMDTHGLRVVHTACRGIAAPWTFRSSLKYRAIEARIFNASGWDPTGNDSRDFELAYSEFTDCVDGVFLGNVRGVKFHHNLLDNVSDDGIFLTAGTAYDGTTHGGDVHIYQNVLSRCLTTFAFGVGHGRQKVLAEGKQTGSGASIYRNVFDFRRYVPYFQPRGASEPQELASYGRVAGDHGGPTWEPMRIYQNTILAYDPPFRNYYLAGLGGHLGRGAQRWLFNNILVQVDGVPGSVFQTPLPKLEADGNLHWSLSAGESAGGDFLKQLRAAKVIEPSKAVYAPGWAARDQFADPRLAGVSGEPREPLDLRLTPGSPAIDAGVPLAAEWPDPLRSHDAAAPDLGALPLGAEPWSVGVHGRLTMFGAPRTPSVNAAALSPLAKIEERTKSAGKPALVMQGYPAFDGPLVSFALRRAGMEVEETERTWVDPREYANYSVVAIVGDLQRAKIEPNKYTSADLVHVEKFLNDGGTLLLLRGNSAPFATPEGRELLTRLLGPAPSTKPGVMKLLQPQHAWLAHLDASAEHEWLLAKNAVPLRGERGECLIGDGRGHSLLHRLAVGQGQLLYVGWEVAASLPAGRKPATVEDERTFDEQMQVLLKLVELQ